VSKIRVSGKSNPKQETSYQGETKVMLSTINTTKFHVRPKISLEIRFIQKPIIIITKLILKCMRHQQKYK
jgi:hypothetical protein